MKKDGNKKGGNKNGITSDVILPSNAGERVHLLDGENGPMIIREMDMSVWLRTGEEYCPECHILMEHKEGYWECAECKHSITDEESEEGEGCPTVEASYSSEYDDYFSGVDISGGEPEVCQECGGNWPECESGCRLFRD